MNSVSSICQEVGFCVAKWIVSNCLLRQRANLHAIVYCFFRCMFSLRIALYFVMMSLFDNVDLGGIALGGGDMGVDGKIA